MRHLFFVLSLICFSSISTSAQKVWTLEECVAYAKANNISIKQAALDQQLSDYSLTQSRLGLLPSINASTNYSFNFGRTLDPTTYRYVNQNTQYNTFSVTGNWDIFNGLQRQNTIKQNQYTLLANQYNTENTTNTVLLYVAGGFLDIVYGEENLKNADDLLKISQLQLDRTKLLVDAGTLAQGSLYDIEAQVARDELNKVTAQNTLDLAKLNLEQLLNLTEPIEVSVPSINMTSEILNQLNITVDSIYRVALETQPNIKSAKYNMMSSEKGIAIARGAQLPSLSLYGSLSTNYSNVQQLSGGDTVVGAPTQIGYVEGSLTPVLAPNVSFIPAFGTEAFGKQFSNNFGQSFGLSLNIPIFNNWQARTNISRSKINMLNAQYNYESVRQTLLKDIQSAYADAVAAKNSYEAAVKGVTSLEKAFDDAQKKFNLGAITSLDYTTAQSNLAKAQSDVLQAKYRYIFKLKVLDFYQGKPLTLQ